jgi:serine/threonine protein kinase
MVIMNQSVYRLVFAHWILIPDIILGEEIGHGSYGVVYKGKWRGQQVAVKKLLRGKIKQEILTEFHHEVRNILPCV